jgi:hypothetical protein
MYIVVLQIMVITKVKSLKTKKIAFNILFSIDF